MRGISLGIAVAMMNLVSAPPACTRVPGTGLSRTSTTGGMVARPHEDPLRSAIEKEELRTAKVATCSPSGVAYIDIIVGEGATPRITDQIVAHYVGWLLNGTQFESSHDRGKPGTFGVSDVVAGCAEGLLTMKIGGKRKIFVPAHLAYGSNGRPGLIPPDSPLIYEFELIAIN